MPIILCVTMLRNPPPPPIVWVIIKAPVVGRDRASLGFLQVCFCTCFTQVQSSGFEVNKGIKIEGRALVPGSGL